MNKSERTAFLRQKTVDNLILLMDGAQRNARVKERRAYAFVEKATEQIGVWKGGC